VFGFGKSDHQRAAEMRRSGHNFESASSRSARLKGEPRAADSIRSARTGRVTDDALSRAAEDVSHTKASQDRRARHRRNTTDHGESFADQDPTARSITGWWRTHRPT
jgi:hypothetical protein